MGLKARDCYDDAVFRSAVDGRFVALSGGKKHAAPPPPVPQCLPPKWLEDGDDQRISESAFTEDYSKPEDVTFSIKVHVYAMYIHFIIKFSSAAVCYLSDCITLPVCFLCTLTRPILKQQTPKSSSLAYIQTF